MTTRRGWATLVLLGMACSTPPSNIGPATADASGDSGPSPMKACTDLATAECSELESCSNVLMQTRFGSLSTCQTRLSVSCISALGAPSTGNTAHDAEACAQAYPSWSCSDYLANINLPAACAQPTGTLANGSACAFAAQCSTGFCAIPPNAPCGTCAPLPSLGDSCANLSSCGERLVCLPLSKVCGTFGELGAVCGKDTPCGAHLSCVGANNAKGTLGTCQASQGVAGAPCDPGLVKGPGCDYDGNLTCNSQSKTCDPLTVSGPGGGCDFQSGQFATCAAGGTCTTMEAGAAGTCVAAAADGQSCSPTGHGPTCLSPARCIVTSAGATTGTCQLDSATCTAPDGG
jgi:hypothetical protein